MPVSINHCLVSSRPMYLGDNQRYADNVVSVVTYVTSKIRVKSSSMLVSVCHADEPREKEPMQAVLLSLRT